MEGSPKLCCVWLCMYWFSPSKTIPTKAHFWNIVLSLDLFNLYKASDQYENDGIMVCCVLVLVRTSVALTVADHGVSC